MPPSALAANDAAKCRSLTGDAAIAACDKAIAKNPRDFNSIYNRGNAFAAKGEHEKAIANYSAAIEIKPKDANAHYNRANSYAALGDDDNAIADYDVVTQINPGFAFAYFNRANSLANKGEDDKAIVDYSEAIKRNPKFAYSYFNRANSLVKKGDAGDSAAYGRAAADYRLAVAKLAASDPIHDQAQNALAEVEAKLEEIKAEAKPEIEVKTGEEVKAGETGAAVDASTGPRVALVIGNGNYAHAQLLANPRNDAQAFADKLSGLGFEVIEGLDLSKAGMEDAIRQFARKASNADLTLLFYAGHGLQIGNRNYLVPVDAELSEESDVAFQLLDVQETIIDLMGRDGSAGIVLLDACRNNPFADKLARSFSKTRATTISSGLAPIQGAGGLLIAFATAPGAVAQDGDGANSPFTTALLHHFDEPGVEIEQMMKRVRNDVFTTSGGKQEPWQNSSLRSEIFLVRQ